MATHRHGRVCVGVDYDTDGVNYQITHLRLLNPLNPKGIETFTMAQYTAKSFENGGLMGFMTLIMK
ncbi:MAG: hypothetical protein IPP30_07600 [Flavobacterium sp.]|nr:hypothetical protein [Flavobacterium sp.]